MSKLLTLSMCSRVVLPALSRPRKRSLACLLSSPNDARTSQNHLNNVSIIETNERRKLLYNEHNYDTWINVTTMMMMWRLFRKVALSTFKIRSEMLRARRPIKTSHTQLFAGSLRAAIFACFVDGHDIFSAHHKQGRRINLQSRVQRRHIQTIFKWLSRSSRNISWVSPQISEQARLTLVLSVHAITAQISPVPNSSGIEVLETDAFRLQCFQTHTGIPVRCND